MAVNGEGIPALGGEAGGDVVNLGHFDGGIQRDAVGIVDEDEVIELERAGNGGSLAGNAFFNAAVTGKAVDIVVENLVLRGVEAGGSVLAGDSEAHGIGNALAQRAGGAFHTGAAAEFRVAGSVGALGAESLHIVHADAEACEVQPAVKEHGAVAAGQDEAVAIEPARLGGVHVEQVTIENSANFSTAQGQTHVPGCFVENSVDGKTSGLICSLLKDFRVHANLSITDAPLL